MPRATQISEFYNDAVPMEFTRALLVQARAYDRDVQAILRAARFPFDPLRQDAQTAFVSREQYSRLCVELFKELGDESGGVIVDRDTLETSVEGVFAIGDIRNTAYKQVVVAAADGCMAAMSIEKYLKGRKTIKVDWIHK